jgi:hydrogenase expression/formation protein HypD
MKYVSEYRGREEAGKLAAAIARTVTRPWVVMEVCGGQTHSIVRHGLTELLPISLELVHGPGCPVCVTPLELIDRALAIAKRPEVTLCSFGDMLRVPGSEDSLLGLKARGSDVRVIYSPLDAVDIAAAHPEREVVLFAVGFETTAPANAMAIHLAHERGLANFSVLVSHVLVPPAIGAVLGDPDNRVQAFLGPGHVCTIVGSADYETIATQHRVPIVITGFEPIDLLEGLLMVVRQLEAGEHRVETQYTRAVTREGNDRARAIIERVFEVCDRKWRGVGSIADSGYALRAEYADHDALRRFSVEHVQTQECAECMSGQILRGLAKPTDCPEFAVRCTPRNPLGATMVSSEGACAAYFAYARRPGAR